ncbi:hypothetical protein C4D60_Mb10t22820 [Musa balbisiana]|uniref:Uncharacterized protein n=1 Tax=Musa balbisiana TaxID=52838 RepID=A0A4S8IZ13_MUSBA|nr:hypothetical protein C4D60_Mb10t22820 [Musa balbisiana]
MNTHCTLLGFCHRKNLWPLQLRRRSSSHSVQYSTSASAAAPKDRRCIGGGENTRRARDRAARAPKRWIPAMAADLGFDLLLFDAVSTQMLSDVKFQKP